jgi:hypothetical protein
MRKRLNRFGLTSNQSAILNHTAIYASPMLALRRIADSSQTSRQVRNVPKSEVVLRLLHLMSAEGLLFQKAGNVVVAWAFGSEPKRRAGL